MKRSRSLVLFTVALCLLVSIFLWSRRSSTRRAARPEQCLDDYYESLQSGELDKCRRCLDEPLRARMEQRDFDAARGDLKDVKNLVQIAGPGESETGRWIDVDEVRPAGVRRLRYHLRRKDDGWVIAAIDPPREIAAPIRYGTPVGDEP